MSYILAISIGPVQEFIASGRRTGDLYAGSALVLEIVQAAACSIEQRPGTDMIFPAGVGTAAANKILAEIQGDPRGAVDAARRSAVETLRRAWAEALAKLPASHINVSLAEQQINSFLEFYAAWCPESGDYPADRRNVERLLAGRKALRDFKQPQKNVDAAKSPFDPALDTVIRRDGRGIPKECGASPLWLRPSEWLDAISLVKRAWEGQSNTPSTADIAARGWLVSHPEIRDSIGRHPEGSIYRSLREEMLAEGKLAEADAARILLALGNCEPDPYFAILQADGDGIGSKLSAICSKQEHQAFSRKLGEFATEARRQIRECGGHLVYGGGDDVLAFIPVHTSIRCAASLQKSFRATGCSLSVGLAIAHYHEPLYITLDYARAAERRAKDSGGDRLALAVHTRGGGARRAECAWGVGLDAWHRWVEAFRGDLSQGLPYEIAQLAREVENTGLPAEVLRAEVARIFARKEGGSQDILPLLHDVTDHAALASLGEELALWRWLARYPLQWEDPS